MDETSLEIVDAGEMYPKQAFVTDDGDCSTPYPLLCGENPLFRGRTSDGLLIVTNYRLYHCEGTYINIPLGLIDYLECREIFHLFIYCKDGRTFRCAFDNTDETQKWLKRLQNCIKLPEKIDLCFAFRYLSWTREEHKDNIVSQTHCNLWALLDTKDSSMEDITSEAERMGFDLKSVWKISKINEDYQLCPSYPRYIIVPSLINDEDMRDLANFRYSRRIPAVVWRHQQNGCVIARSSQPRMGILSWRNGNDEKLIEAISVACAMDPGFEAKVNSPEENFIKSEEDSDIAIFYDHATKKRNLQKKLLIIDARSYAAAVTNRAKGGGYECDGYYPNCEIQYMGLANIHTIRNSFNCLRTLCALPDDLNWLSSLENTKWLHHISGLIRAALLVVNAVDVEERPVLVHCSDGWDRTPQIVSLAEIMLDPYYRTKKGFQVLVEREWLDFGHKFADRCGHPDGTDDRNERCPVFLQWLDCIYQLLQQFQCLFEFNEQYLARLALHTYSCLFGTFLCNTDESRRRTHSVPLRTFSIWPVLNEKSQFHNYLYCHTNEVLRPSYQIRNLLFWSDVYLPNCPLNLGKTAIPPVDDSSLPAENLDKTNLVKTKSCDNIHSSEHSQVLQRRNSDPTLLDNAFPESTHLYPKVPDLNEDNLCTPNVLVISEIFPHSENKDTVTTKERIENSERTSKLCGQASNSNLILLKPGINGSTDTLVSESGAIISELNKGGKDLTEVRNSFPDLKLRSSVSTDTSDLPLSVEDILQSITCNGNYVDSRLPNWCQNVIGAFICSRRNLSNNSCSCSYATPNHSRTPSSGFPATPCDDSSDMPNLKRDIVCQTMDFDGLNLVSNFVQERIKKLILHYKNKVGNLHMELSAARCEFLQHVCHYYQGKEGRFLDVEEAVSIPDSASSGEPLPESGGSESSWDFLCSPDHTAANVTVRM